MREWLAALLATTSRGPDWASRRGSLGVPTTGGRRGEGEAFLPGTGARRPMTHCRHADHKGICRHADHKAMFGINPH